MTLINLVSKPTHTRSSYSWLELNSWQKFRREKCFLFLFTQLKIAVSVKASHHVCILYVCIYRDICLCTYYINLSICTHTYLLYIHTHVKCIKISKQTYMCIHMHIHVYTNINIYTILNEVEHAKRIAMQQVHI